jgi:hypothetical protein
MSQTWECAVCRATATIYLERQPVRYDSCYPADTGPYADRPAPPHACPIRQGLLPPAIAANPHARQKA